MNSEMREMLERYLGGDLSEIELEAFLTLVRNDPEALSEMKQALLQQAMLFDVLRTPQAGRAEPSAEARAEGRKASRVTPATGSGLRASASGRRTSARATPPSGSSKRLRATEEVTTAEATPDGPSLLSRWQWRVAAAAMLIVVGGLIALWINVRTDRDAILAERQARRRQEILRQIAELETEAKAAMLPPAVSDAGRREPPHPQAPRLVPSDEPEGKTLDENSMRLAAAEQRRRETEEATRLIDARRQQLLARLREFPVRRPRADDTDEEPDLPVTSNETGVVVAGRGVSEDPEIGRVTYVQESQKSGIVVRVDAQEEVRLGLRAGMRLNRGDRIETAAGNEMTGTTVELAGGARLDLDQKTIVVVLEPDEARLSTGRIYACVAPPSSMDSDRSAAPPFTLETTSGRYLTQDVRAEIYASPQFTTPQTRARVDQGRIHLMNKKGLATGGKGQEIQSQALLTPQRAEGFTGPIWRGRDLPTAGLPFSKSNLLIFSNENPTRWFTEDYAMALSHRGEIRLASLQVSQGNLEDPQRQFQLLAREANQFRRMGMRNIPQPAQGVMKPLFKPASGIPAETRAESSVAVMEILAGARVCTPERPLVIVCAGSLTDVASAWLLDRSVSERVVVVGPFAGPGIEYEFDPWAAEIVLSNYRCVLGGNSPLTVDAQRLSRIADQRWVRFAGKASGGDPEFGKLAIATVPDFVKETQRNRFIGMVNGRPEFQPDPQGRIWLLMKTDPTALLREFDQTFLRSGP